MISHEAYTIVKDFFNDDNKKTIAWFETPNMYLNGISPMRMIKLGRVKKLEKFIYSHLKNGWF